MALLPGTRFAETAHRNKHILQLQQIEDAIEGLLCDLGTGGAIRLFTVERPRTESTSPVALRRFMETTPHNEQR